MLSATARSAMVASSVSPERCELIARHRCAADLHRFDGLAERTDLVHFDQQALRAFP